MRSLLFCLLLGVFAWSIACGTETSVSSPAVDAARAAEKTRLASLSAAPKPELVTHGLVAEELGRWKAHGASQGVAVDAHYFYGIGNYLVGKYDKLTGERVAEWVGLRGGELIHLNGGIIQEGQLVLAHSNFPQQPMASSIEYFDAATVRPIKSVSLGIRHGSLTWAEKQDGYWWACFAHYSDSSPVADNRSTLFGKFDEHWQPLESWLFPPQVIAQWGKTSSSGGSWGDDGLLYTTGHDEKKLYVMRLPKMGVALEYVTTIDVPFAGQSWAWDRSEKRVIYGITRSTGEVVVARIPEIPEQLKRR